MERNNIKQTVKLYVPVFIVNIIFAFIIYFLLMSNQLVNPYDGIWEYSYHIAQKWELSLGRWAWQYLDKLRFGISVDPLTSLITLACYCTSIILVLDLFEIKRRKTGYLITTLFLSNVAVCVTLSYRYMSPTFGVAFLFNVLAAWLVIKLQNHFWSVFVSAVLIGLGMGLYQADLGCACIVLLGYLIYSLYKEDITVRQIFCMLLRGFLAVGIGGIVYVAGLKLCLYTSQLQLSDYNGANSYSLGNTLIKFFGSFKKSYLSFKLFFPHNVYKQNTFQGNRIYYIIFALMAVLLFCGFLKIFKHGKIRALLYALFGLLIPVAANAVLFIATDVDVSIQMTTPMALCLPVLLCIIANLELSNAFMKWMNRICIFFALVVLYGSIYQVQTDQNAMLEGKVTTTALADEIVHALADSNNISSDYRYCIVGVPAGNTLFKVSPLFLEANSYAQFGCWWLDSTCTRKSWQGVFSNLCGVNLPICSNDEYNSIVADEAVENMPLFPLEGSIIKMGDVVVVKVSGL